MVWHAASITNLHRYRFVLNGRAFWVSARSEAALDAAVRTICAYAQPDAA